MTVQSMASICMTYVVMFSNLYAIVRAIVTQQMLYYKFVVNVKYLNEQYNLKSIFLAMLVKVTNQL
jgi:hypothetical protein